MPKRNAGSGVKSYTIERSSTSDLQVRLDDSGDDGIYVQMRKKGTGTWKDVIHFTLEGKFARSALADTLGLKTLEKYGEDVILMLREPE